MKAKNAVLVASAVVIGGVAIGGALTAFDRVVNQEDSGVAMCKAIASQSRVVARNGDTPMTEDEYRRIRNEFDRSAVNNIRDAGKSFVDSTWQVAHMGENDPLLFAYAGDVITSYQRLVTACADSDVFLPSLSELTTLRESASPSPRSTN